MTGCTGRAPRSVQAVLFDLDGVLRRWPEDQEHEAEAAAGLPAGAVARVAFSRGLLLPAITGRSTDEQWRRDVVAALLRQFPGVAVDRAVAAWSDSAGAVDPDVLQLIHACRRRARVVLVTNATTRLPRDLARLGLSATFDAVVNSADVGHAKPNQAIYAAALAAAGVDAGDALFVDDLAENTEAAAALGLAVHLFHSPQGLRADLAYHQVLGAGSENAEPPPV